MAIYRLLKNRAFGPLCHPPTPGVIQTGRPLNAPCPSMKFVCASGATDGAKCAMAGMGATGLCVRRSNRYW
jgi:hypothetical protein